MARNTSHGEDANIGQEETYGVGYNSDVTDFFGARRANTHTAFFLPYLRAGMNLLDCGCGPGSITTDLAEIVYPGRVVGIDMESSQIEIARNHAMKRNVSNVEFEMANVYEIPFAEESFDAVLMHGLAEHLNDPPRAFAQAYSVLKSGGIVATRDADWGGFLMAPSDPTLEQFFQLYQKVMRHGGGDPHFGRRQKLVLKEAGFEDIRVSASYDCWSQTPEATREIAEMFASMCLDSTTVEEAVRLNYANSSTFEKMSAAFKKWGEHPAAFMAEAWGEAIGRKA